MKTIWGTEENFPLAFHILEQFNKNLNPVEDQNRHGWNNISVIEEKLEIILMNASEKGKVIRVLRKEPIDIEGRDNI